MKNEVGWSEAYSPLLTTHAAVTPSQMSAPSTAVDGLGVKLTWDAPATGGRPITGYRVYIRAQDGTFKLEETHCSVSATECSVPLLELQQSPFNLVQGDLVQAKVRAVNSIGESLDSSQNTDGARIETVPSAPPVAP